jgi:hypothetical protein
MSESAKSRVQKVLLHSAVLSDKWLVVCNNKMLPEAPGALISVSGTFLHGPHHWPTTYNQFNYSAHTVHDHPPALDSGFRRNDVSYSAVFKSVIPAKAGAFRYPV